ncbi:type II toxin-antitoxin system VapC family toxin [Thermococcus aciditolerans]|uniref:Type II toxin-antitoxin system VapC family toxin n=1 Tax=Thermococcus aciditolerans TaxID=2598455 RepID=A0A5C0SKT8_9EURY|nr:type II toxin-antitoxin system VapC family toxin [Thermococcus aciditolerans]QEK14983.1 type II toxin-antitoxin system VapC family toxin [Thermococcus aciditolerans]
MIVVDTSVFIDAIFEYREERTAIARKLFRTLQEAKTQVLEPDIFKIELIGQLVRRMEVQKAMNLYELLMERIETMDTAKLREVAFEIALKTGCRAIDSFYISAAHSRNAILVSNDKFQVESALKYGIKAFYLLEEWQELNKLLKKSGWVS